MLTKSWLAQLPLSEIKRVAAVSGGDINQAYRIDTAQQHYFLKVQAQQQSVFFDHEQEGLKLLAPAVRVPPI